MTTPNPAQERVNESFKRLKEVQAEVTNALAEGLRIELLRFAEGKPVHGFVFETSWEYDDQGGYFPVSTAWAEWSEESEAMVNHEDELLDISHQWLNEDVIALLGEQVSVERLKEESF